MVLQLHDRVIFQQDIAQNISVKAGTIGTVRAIIQDRILVQVGFDTERRQPKLISVSKDKLVPANVNDIDEQIKTLYDCCNVLHSGLHPGMQYFDYNTSSEFEIMGVKLAITETKDLFKIVSLPDVTIQRDLIDWEYIHHNCVSIRYNETPINNAADESTDESTDNSMTSTIVINDINFTIDNDNITVNHTMHKNKLEEYIMTLIKLNKKLGE